MGQLGESWQGIEDVIMQGPASNPSGSYVDYATLECRIRFAGSDGYGRRAECRENRIVQRMGAESLAFKECKIYRRLPGPEYEADSGRNHAQQDGVELLLMDLVERVEGA